MRLRNLTLDTICNGAARELFEAELQRVVDNINDSNVPATEKRKVTLEFTFSPSPERDWAGITMQTKVALAKMRSVEGGLIFDDEGKAMCKIEKQGSLPFDNVSKIKKGKK